MKTPMQWFRLVADAGFAQIIRARRRDPPLAVGVGVTLLLLGGSLMPGRAQTVDSYPVPIYGSVGFNNPLGSVYDHLNSASPLHGLGRGSISAISVTPGYAFSAETGVNDDPANHLSTPYTITVQGADSGVAYSVTALMDMEEPYHGYAFAPVTSAAVVYDTVNNLPGPPVLLDITECAGLIEMQFRDELDNPVTIPGGAWLHAYLLPSMALQSWGGLDTVSDARLAVRGGEDFRLTLTIPYASGTDDYFDRITWTYAAEYTVTVGCDEIVTIKVILPSGSGSGPGSGSGLPLGQIIGWVDLLAVNEHFEHRGWGTTMSAKEGPFGNYRYDSVEPACFPGCGSPLIGTPTDNSSGPFLLPNLLPSDFVSPPRGYSVWAQMFFGVGRRYQVFSSPALNDSTPYNPTVMVPPNTTVDLGSTFVMDPGWVQGAIFLCGFGGSTDPHSALRSLYRASDDSVNFPGIPDSIHLWNSSCVAASGLGVLGAGATTTASYGGGVALFEGEVADSGPDQGSFVGDYVLTLAGLKQETTRWNVGGLNLVFKNVATPDDPDSYIDSWVGIVNRHFADVEIVPGATTILDHCYGTSRVTVRWHANSGTLFNPAVVSGYGEFVGTNFKGDPADYYVSFWGYGTPNSFAERDDDGLVVIVLPQGTHTFSPTVESVNPDDQSWSHNVFPNMTIVVSPCANIEVQPCLVLNAPLPECVAQPELLVPVSVSSCDEVASITYTLNGNTVTVCEDCGINPTFSVSVTLADCDNALKIMATDVNGRVSSVSKIVHFDGTPPEWGGCQDRAVNILPGEPGAVVDFVVTATDNCDGAVAVTCDPPSGSFFLEGTTLVTCLAIDRCGNVTNCTFTVTVSARDIEPPTAECVPTTNPAGKQIPVAGKNPKSGHNPDGFYLLLAHDNQDAPSDLRLYVKDSFEGPCGGAFRAGPYMPGTKVKLTQSPGQASVKPMAGDVPWHINTRGEPLLVAVDTAGNESICEQCFVPPPPK